MHDHRWELISMPGFSKIPQHFKHGFLPRKTTEETSSSSSGIGCSFCDKRFLNIKFILRYKKNVKNQHKVKIKRALPVNTTIT